MEYNFSNVKPPSSYSYFDRKLRRKNKITKEMKDLPKTYNSKNCYHTNPMTYYYRTLRELQDLPLKANKNDKFLDWGCSTGVSTIAIANSFKEATVIGLDISETRVKIALQRTLVTLKKGYITVYNSSIASLVKEEIPNPECIKVPKAFLVADGFNSPFKDKEFNTVFCMNNIYYILNKADEADLSLKMRELLRVIKEKGHLLITGTDDLINLEILLLEKRDNKMQPVCSTFTLNNETSRKRMELIMKMCNRS
ncbi:MAG: class I SAM-dependent methyltransferase [Candidatus Micrarchaeia archaeon]